VAEKGKGFKKHSFTQSRHFLCLSFTFISSKIKRQIEFSCSCPNHLEMLLTAIFSLFKEVEEERQAKYDIQK